MYVRGICYPLCLVFFQPTKWFNSPRKFPTVVEPTLQKTKVTVSWSIFHRHVSYLHHNESPFPFRKIQTLYNVITENRIFSGGRTTRTITTHLSKGKLSCTHFVYLTSWEGRIVPSPTRSGPTWSRTRLVGVPESVQRSGNDDSKSQESTLPLVLWLKNHPQTICDPGKKEDEMGRLEKEKDWRRRKPSPVLSKVSKNPLIFY